MCCASAIMPTWSRVLIGHLQPDSIWADRKSKKLASRWAIYHAFQRVDCESQCVTDEARHIDKSLNRSGFGLNRLRRLCRVVVCPQESEQPE